MFQLKINYLQKKNEKISTVSSRWNLNGREITNIPLINTSTNANLDFSIQSLIPKCKMERVKKIINNKLGKLIQEKKKTTGIKI